MEVCAAEAGGGNGNEDLVAGQGLVGGSRLDDVARFGALEDREDDFVFRSHLGEDCLGLEDDVVRRSIGRVGVVEGMGRVVNIYILDVPRLDLTNYRVMRHVNGIPEIPG